MANLTFHLPDADGSTAQEVMELVRNSSQKKGESCEFGLAKVYWEDEDRNQFTLRSTFRMIYDAKLEVTRIEHLSPVQNIFTANQEILVRTRSTS